MSQGTRPCIRNHQLQMPGLVKSSTKPINHVVMHPMMRLLLIPVAWLALSGGVLGQESEGGWPERPVRLVVPFPAGSSTDIVSRIIAQKLAPRLRQQVVIENRAGASGNIGAETVARAAPDGYTIGIATASTHAVAASLSAKLSYDPIADFAPVGMIASRTLCARRFSGIAGAQSVRARRARQGEAGDAHLRLGGRSEFLLTSPPRCSRAWRAWTFFMSPTRAPHNR